MNNDILKASLPAAQQTFHNTTSWLGYRNSDKLEVATGQTFVAVKEGELENIEVFSSMVTTPGLLHMTLHQYDAVEDKWGPSLASASLPVNAGQNDRWLVFKMPGLHLSKGATYGFKLESNDTFIGIGEAVGCAGNPPYEAGIQWRFNKLEKKANLYKYFSLAFKVALSA